MTIQLQSLEVVPPYLVGTRTVSQLDTAIRSTTIHLEHLTRGIDQLDRHMAEIINNPVSLADLPLWATVWMVGHDGLPVFTDRSHQFSSSTVYERMRMTRYHVHDAAVACREQIQELTSHKKTAEKQGEGLSVTFTIEGLREQLRKISGVNPRSIRLETSETGKPRIAFMFEGLKMTPDVNHYPSIYGGRKDVQVALPKFLVRIDLSRMGAVTAHHIRNQPRYAMYSGRSSVHPHNLNSTGTLCLGDFAGPVEELRAKLDIPTLVQVLREFFCQATAGDAAGQHWATMVKAQFFRRFGIGTGSIVLERSTFLTRLYVPGFDMTWASHGVLMPDGDTWKLFPIRNGKLMLYSDICSSLLPTCNFRNAFPQSQEEICAVGEQLELECLPEPEPLNVVEASSTGTPPTEPSGTLIIRELGYAATIEEVLAMCSPT